MGGHVILYRDDLEELATHQAVTRSLFCPAAEMHEATRRVLGVLLRHLDGFDSTNKRTVVIGATNRKQVSWV